MIALHRIHMNPDQWREPERYIPERFNPESPWYLIPGSQTKKRHPMSFGPFLGGKRVCLGKTFAENVVKSILPLILSQVAFEIPPESDIASDIKPALNHFSGQPLYLVKVSQVE